MAAWLSALILITPLNIWAASTLSLAVLLHAYVALFSGVMKGLAVAILVAGIVLPPASLAYWVWEVLREVPLG